MPSIFSGRGQLYSDDEEVLFEAARPILLNGIEDVISRPDLGDRGIFLTWPPLARCNDALKTSCGGSLKSRGRASSVPCWMRWCTGCAPCVASTSKRPQTMLTVLTQTPPSLSGS